MQVINGFDKNKFISIFGNVFESTNLIAEKVYYLSPFKNFDDLRLKMIKIFESLTRDNQLQIFLNHPDLANKVKISSLSNESKKEQEDSKLDQCSVDEFNEFKKLNLMYKEKFGFPFILAVSGKKKEEILNSFRSRVSSTKKVEFNEAKNQVIKIAALRLNNIEKEFYKK